MDHLDVRYVALCARCTQHAKNQLARLLSHPRFPDILAALELIPGPIYALDIEHALYETVSRAAAGKTKPSN